MPNPSQPAKAPNAAKPPKPYVPFSRAVADRILAGLSEGRGLRALCRGAHMPTRPTVMRWLKERPAFADEVFLARLLGGLDRPGRPSRLTPALLDTIYLRLCHGEPLRAVCADPAMPARSTVQAWAAADPQVAHAVDLGRNAARQEAAERLLDASGWGPWIRARWAAEAEGRPPPDTPPPGDASAPAAPPPRSGGRGTVRRRADGGGGKPHPRGPPPPRCSPQGGAVAKRLRGLPPRPKKSSPPRAGPELGAACPRAERSSVPGDRQGRP